MWFKNLRVYRLSAPLPAFEELEAKLADLPFKPCSGQETQRLGFVSPLGREGKLHAHPADGYTMVCAKRQDKLLPSAAIDELLQEKLEQIDRDEGRRVSRREKMDLKDEIIFDLLPRAFTRSSLLFGYATADGEHLFIDAASASRAEDLLAGMRTALGSISAVPLTPADPITRVLTGWLRGEPLPDGLTLGEECELESPKDEGRVWRCKKQDLTAPEVMQHLDTGMVVRKLALQWQGSISFVLDEEFAIRRLKFSDELVEKAGERSPESAAEAFDQDFAVMRLELDALVAGLLVGCGGLREGKAELREAV